MATGGLLAPALGVDLGALAGGATSALGGLASGAESAIGGLGSSIGSLLGGGAGLGISGLPGEAAAGDFSAIGLAPLGGDAASVTGAAPTIADTATGLPTDLAGTANLGNAAGGDIGASSISMPGEGGGTNLASMVTGALGKNPLGSAVAGGGLLYSVLNGQKSLPTTNAIQGASNQYATQGQNLVTQGTSLQSYLQNGTLPPALQAQVNQAVAAAKARAIAAAGSRGLSTDPTKNSALAQDLTNIDMQGISEAGQLEQQLSQQGSSLINSGTNFLNMSNQDLISLSNIQQQQTANIGRSIANFAAALGGSSKIQIGGNAASVSVG